MADEFDHRNGRIHAGSRHNLQARPEQLKGPEANRNELADQLVTKAQQTAARIRFIEDPALLAEVGGVGALLRFRI